MPHMPRASWNPEQALCVLSNSFVGSGRWATRTGTQPTNNSIKTKKTVSLYTWKKNLILCALLFCSYLVFCPDKLQTVVLSESTSRLPAGVAELWETWETHTHTHTLTLSRPGVAEWTCNHRQPGTALFDDHLRPVPHRSRPPALPHKVDLD
ncbi:hypothetical protein RRG08_032469 [Elysia crispata]|uniref:Uncharacterized protein n=1 Tax=Elysia crispata TaxID=231223 RepID=A0AAE1BA44_9GAST|nr:hypothetical protein RRG08_032469 [Elysia crispata]